LFDTQSVFYSLKLNTPNLSEREFDDLELGLRIDEKLSFPPPLCKCCSPPMFYQSPVYLSNCKHIVCNHTVVYLNNGYQCPLCNTDNDSIIDDDTTIKKIESRISKYSTSNYCINHQTQEYDSLCLTCHKLLCTYCQHRTSHQVIRTSMSPGNIIAIIENILKKDIIKLIDNEIKYNKELIEILELQFNNIYKPTTTTAYQQQQHIALIKSEFIKQANQHYNENQLENLKQQTQDIISNFNNTTRDRSNLEHYFLLIWHKLEIITLQLLERKDKYTIYIQDVAVLWDNNNNNRTTILTKIDDIQLKLTPNDIYQSLNGIPKMDSFKHIFKLFVY